MTNGLGIEQLCWRPPQPQPAKHES